MNTERDSEEEYLRQAREARAESVRYFSSDNKPERERWVAFEFLTNLGVAFVESEVRSVVDEPPDVEFRAAAFEVKEIQDPGRRRHAEYKASLARAIAATSPEELLEPVTPRDITYSEICDRVEDEVARFSSKYSVETRAKLDLLFYVNLEDVYGYAATPLPPPSRWEQYGFRSVLVVMGRLGGVLMASDSAPEFLRLPGPRIVMRPREGESGGAI
jgi:hypothetical protein